ncbi:uncharacterized protein LOC135206659 isoform X1 [Macrobrachium nipponense]|uniref:uncharacterized protein LOC135206659 isoform X1 n=1 Tax=Macrobrachium nipponense TaxID=159736 RepID=UPI0030C8A2CB
MAFKVKFFKGPRKIKSPVVEFEDDEEASGHQKDGELGSLEIKSGKEKFIKNDETDEVKVEVMEEELIKDEDSVRYQDESITRDKEDTEEKKVGNCADICSGSKEPRESLITEEMTVSDKTHCFKRRRRESNCKLPLKDDFIYEWAKGRKLRKQRQQEEVGDINEGGRGSLVKDKNVRKGKLAVKAQVTRKVQSNTFSDNKNGRNARANVSRTRKLVRKDDCDHSQPNSSKVKPKRGINRKQNKEVIIKCEDSELQVRPVIDGKLSIQDPSHQEPVVEERTLKCDLDDTENEEESMKEGLVSYVIIPKATQRGKMRLISSDGFTYNVKYSYMENRSWVCSHRPKFEKACGVIVRQFIDKDFFIKKGEHNHPPDSTALANSYIVSEIKKKSKTDFLNNPKEIIENILQENNELNAHGRTFNVDYLVRTFNRVRHRIKELHPILCTFKINKIPQDFLQGDIVFRNDRTLIFSTKEQLRLLSRTDRWYIDITEKFASFPFSHLMSISSYVMVQDSDDTVVLKPLVFFIMSSISRINLRKAITRLIKQLKKPLCVRSFVLDFYPDLWSAIRSLFFNCKLYGCAWKFGQNVWAKVQDYGNQEDILELNDHIHKLLKLPFLPTREIRLAFQLLREDFLRYPEFRLLIEYIEASWLNNSVWRIANWSVFGNPFRTKSDVVSWHYSIPLRRNHYISISDLVHELYMLSCSLSSVQRPVHQRSVKQFYKGNMNSVQGKMFLLWDKESVMPHLEFLASCCQFSEPSLEVYGQEIE